MKKLVILMLVLAAGSMANAATAVYLSGDVEAVEGTEFTLLVNGLAGAAQGNGFSGGVFSAMGFAGTGPIAWVVEQAAGNLGSADPFASAVFDLNGIYLTAGQLDPVAAEDFVGDGVWLTGTYVAGPAGTSETFRLFNYAFSDEVPVSSWTVNYIPEPMSLLLLGLGGLFLRRRK